MEHGTRVTHVENVRREDGEARLRAGIWLSLAVSATLLGCPIDERTLSPITVVVHPEAGAAGSDGRSGAAGADAGTGGDAGASGDPGVSGSNSGGGGGSSASGGSSGKGGTTGGSGGSGGAACGCGGGGGEPAERCPDLDANLIPDCDETLAANASFNADVRGWTSDTGAVLTWRDSDAHGRAESGALGLENQSEGDRDGSAMLGARQCFSVIGGGVYTHAVEISVPDDAEDVRAGFQLIVYESPGCSGAATHSADSMLSTGAAWKAAQITYLMPTLAKSVAMRLITIKPFRDPPIEVQFDNVLVRRD